MKKLILYSLALFCLPLMAQNDIMFEMVTMTPKDGMSEALISKMKMHNDKMQREDKKIAVSKMKKPATK